MASTIKTSSHSGLRDQIVANLETCLPDRFSDLEIITSNIAVFKTAWIVDSKHSTDSKDTPKAIMKGPPCLTNHGALERLLEASSALVGQEMASVFEQFEGELSVMVGEGFVKEHVLCGQEMGSSDQN